MIILYIVFNKFIRFDMEYYALYLLSGITTWRFFVNSTSSGIFAFYKNREIVLKVKMPRLLLPVSIVMTNFIITIFEYIIYFVIFFILKGNLSIVMLIIIPFLILYLIFIFGISLILSLIYVFFKDIKPAWEISIQVLFFLSPIFYPFYIIPMKYMGLYLLNPLAVFIMAFHDILYNNVVPDLTVIINSSFFAVVSFIIGITFFGLIEKRMVKSI